MDSDPSYLHEKYAYDLFRSYGVYVPEITLTNVVVEIEGDSIDYGVYTAEQAWERQPEEPRKLQSVPLSRATSTGMSTNRFISI